MSKYFSGIHYQQMEPLFLLTKNHKEAIFLDKILYWFNISNFKLPRSSDQRIWFTRTYEQMSTETHIPISTLKRYMRKFVNMGLIERSRKKLGINVRAYFTVTEKLLSMTRKEKNLTKSDTSRRSKKDLSIYKDQSFKTINISPLNQKEEMANKLIKEVSINISNPKQLKDEILFTLDNPFYFKETKNLFHKLNIVKKLISKGVWRTPKGFSKYSDNASKYQFKKEVKDEPNNQHRQFHANNKKNCLQKLSSINGEIKSLEKLAKFDVLITPQLNKAHQLRDSILTELRSYEIPI